MQLNGKICITWLTFLKIKYETKSTKSIKLSHYFPCNPSNRIKWVFIYSISKKLNFIRISIQHNYNWKNLIQKVFNTVSNK